MSYHKPQVLVGLADNLCQQIRRCFVSQFIGQMSARARLSRETQQALRNGTDVLLTDNR